MMPFKKKKKTHTVIQQWVSRLETLCDIFLLIAVKSFLYKICRMIKNHDMYHFTHMFDTMLEPWL